MVTCIEQRLRLVEAKTDDHTAELRDVKQNVAEVQRVVEDGIIEWPRIQRSQANVGGIASFEEQSRQMKTAYPPSMADTVRSQPTLSNVKPSSVRKQSGVRKQSPHQRSDGKTDADITAVETYKVNQDTVSDGWQYERQQKRKLMNGQRKKNAVFGKRSGSFIKSGLKHVDLFVFRVHCDVEDESLSSFLTDENISVIKFEKVSHDDSIMKSYKVTIKHDDLEKVMNEDFWPDGIGCRKFFSKRKESSYITL